MPRLTREEVIDLAIRRLGYELDNDGQIVIYTGRYKEEASV